MPCIVLRNLSCRPHFVRCSDKHGRVRPDLESEVDRSKALLLITFGLPAEFFFSQRHTAESSCQIIGCPQPRKVTLIFPGPAPAPPLKKRVESSRVSRAVCHD